ncbi:conserved hypothetical protein [Ruegeria lacuscaerulensis ITI-1157]|nr:conserved hypothetical protein [Ruegeria lacuscaerulensis ITI-1157]SHI71105.1 protein of unknown function [Ruegeria lacuscaerulensis ITI-1157]
MTPDTEGKSLVELLDMLKPAPEPSPISMVPQTWGWGVLAVALLLVLGLILVTVWRHRQANAYRRYALKELDRCQNDPAKAAEIVRRAALAAFPRSQVAGLIGDDWTGFLRQTADLSEFSASALGTLAAAPYRKGVTDPDAVELARHWIKSHRAKGAV